MIKRTMIAVACLLLMFVYAVVANALYRWFERRFPDACHTTPGPFIAAALWPIAPLPWFVGWFVFVLPYRLVRRVETRWRDRAAVKAQTPKAKVYR